MARGIIIPWLSQSTPSGHYSQAATNLLAVSELHYLGRRAGLSGAKEGGGQAWVGSTGRGSERKER